MARWILCSVALLLALPATVSATPTIIVGSHPSLLPNVASQTFDVFVTGLDDSTTIVNGHTVHSNSIGGIDLWVSIASGQKFAPAGQPKINSIDVVTGTIFAGNSAFSAPGEIILSSDQVWEINNLTNSGVITTNGKLFTIDINTLGAAPNATWALSVFSVDAADGPFDSTYSNDQVLGQVFLGSNGSFTQIPEPSTFALALIAVGGLGVAIVRRRTRAS